MCIYVCRHSYVVQCLCLSMQWWMRWWSWLVAGIMEHGKWCEISAPLSPVQRISEEGSSVWSVIWFFQDDDIHYLNLSSASSRLRSPCFLFFLRILFLVLSPVWSPTSTTTNDDDDTTFLLHIRTYMLREVEGKTCTVSSCTNWKINRIEDFCITWLLHTYVLHPRLILYTPHIHKY